MKRLLALMVACTLLGTLTMGCAKTESPKTPDPKPVETPKEPEKPAEQPKAEQPKQEELIQVNLSEVAHSVFYAPQYVALELGFFKEEGLDVTLTNGNGADKVMTAVVAGQADIGLAGPEATVYLYNQGKENHAVIFAQLTKRDGSFIVGREKDDNFSWEKLRGKDIIGGRKGGMPEMTLEYVLNQKGIVPHKDITIDTGVQFALMAGAFSGGQGDYVALFEPTASMVEKEGKGFVLASVGQDSGEIPYTAYFASKEYMAQNPEVIQKFTNAVYKGQLWVQNNSPEEIAKLMEKHFPDTGLDILTSVAKRYQSIDAWSSDPIMTADSVELMQKVMESAGELTQKAPYDKIVNTEFAKKAMETIK